MCFVGGIGEVNLSADGPNWSRLEKLLRTEGVCMYAVHTYIMLY